MNNSIQQNKKSVQEIFGPLELRLFKFSNHFYTNEVYPYNQVHNEYLNQLKEDVIFADYAESITKINAILLEINILLQDRIKLKANLKEKMILHDYDAYAINSEEAHLSMIEQEIELCSKELIIVRDLLTTKLENEYANQQQKIKTKLTVSEMALFLSLLSEDTDYLQIPDKSNGITKTSVIKMITSTFTSKKDGTKPISESSLKNKTTDVDRATAQSVNTILDKLKAKISQKYL
ncbi:MAG: hypothetical protein CVT99_02330 [Bacteroidetes bacterium HGW-Bacteroidetes-16]|jgi:hypothetical protein|nr:MAG: hypothetical protein CVT99_02330 [Bacteroidetes bacterium HGW-Bacteroidetes-16]